MLTRGSRKLSILTHHTKYTWYHTIGERWLTYAIMTCNWITNIVTYKELDGIVTEECEYESLVLTDFMTPVVDKDGMPLYRQHGGNYLIDAYIRPFTVNGKECKLDCNVIRNL